MGKKKHKHQGHYCKMCGEYKSNESFSGKGHRLHICKKCISIRNKAKKENEQTTDKTKLAEKKMYNEWSL